MEPFEDGKMTITFIQTETDDEVHLDSYVNGKKSARATIEKICIDEGLLLGIDIIEETKKAIHDDLKRELKRKNETI